MLSEIDICNMALGHLGKGSISALSDNTPAAQKCALFYPIARDAVQRAHPWNFTTRVVELALVANVQVLGWDYIYSQPAQCLLVRKLDDATTINTKEKTPFKLIRIGTNSEEVIATDLVGAFAEYTMRVTDTTRFDATYTMALSFYLASLLAQPLCGDRKLGNDLLTPYRLELDQARAANAVESKPVELSTSSFEDAR